MTLSIFRFPARAALTSLLVVSSAYAQTAAHSSARVETATALRWNYTTKRAEVAVPSITASGSQAAGRWRVWGGARGLKRG